jgi:hypothetical protein
MIANNLALPSSQYNCRTTRSHSNQFIPIPTQRSYMFSRSPLVVEIRTFNWIGVDLKKLNTLYSAKIFIKKKLFELFQLEFNLNIVNRGFLVGQLNAF